MNIAIIGAGGFGREVLSLINVINHDRTTFSVAGFIDDNIEKGRFIHDCPILGTIEDPL